jgi:acetyl-CoA/propionyl-CoA carboxylase biotin carboxyl carrier protein
VSATGGSAPVDGKGRKDVTAEVNGRRVNVSLWVEENGDDGLPKAHSTAAKPRRQHHTGAIGSGSGKVAVAMQGTIVKVSVAEGDTVEVGQAIVILEAMKMENNVNAEKAGVVKSIKVKPGDSVAAGDIVAIIE